MTRPGAERSPTAPPALIADPSDLVRACEGLRGRVAVDTEFHAERRHTPQLYLIQLKPSAGPAWLIDVPAVGSLAPLGDALSRCELLVHGGERDLQLLGRHAGLVPGEVVDTQILAGFCGLGFPRRLEDLQQEVLGVSGDDSKPGLSDWSRRPLSPRQLAYAAADVENLHALAEALDARTPTERRPWAREETRDRVRRWLGEPDPDQLWRLMPAARVLNGRERQRLRHLAAWRAGEAAERDLGPWNIASDRVLVDLARRAPASIADLSANRLTPKGLVKRYGAVLVQRIQEAPDVPLRPLPTTPQERAALALVQAWALGVEARTGVASALLLPPWRLDAWLSDWQRDQAIEDCCPWVESFSGVELRSLFDGALALALTPDAGAAPRY